MGKLLEQIRDAAVDSSTDIGEVLRRALVLANRLGLTDLQEWIESELNGYPESVNLPDYRYTTVNSVGYFSGPAGSALNNAPIPLGNLPEEIRKALSKLRLPQPAAAYQRLAKDATGGFLIVDWPPDVVAQYAGEFYAGMNCIKAVRQVPVSVVVSLVEAVRNRLLRFVLELETTNPDAGEAVGPLPPVQRERVENIFQTHILGSTVANLAVGGINFEQSATVVITRATSGPWN